ncbi:MAG: hypothetical protein JWN14_3588, partial [Chthonomonadales bacterium]|nr:hypothetical protein [Chthonomonadales bacterium]
MIDVQYINRRLKIQEAQIHIGQVGSGNKFFWISANDKSYRFKVNIAFINLLQELLREHEDIADESANEYSD